MLSAVWWPPASRIVVSRYCRFYQGRRIDDDERQIGRWKGVAGKPSMGVIKLSTVLQTSPHCDDQFFGLSFSLP